MASVLERRDDGTVALYINGDLQFDSGDERIYHEALALPALAIALQRIEQPLKVLVIGGGDGLTARELFKCASVQNVDLVDYDPEILDFARRELSFHNESSLVDERINIHVQDAWEYVDKAIESGAAYDVIISDLTVAENVMEARFHTIDWYTKLRRMLSDQGVLAINGVSPQATPQAYWSIFNSISAAQLHVRPLHVVIPSFAAAGFGDDWGFFLASKEPISQGEATAGLPDTITRKVLISGDDLRNLFVFPQELFSYQPKSLPARAGSDILLYYFNNRTSLSVTAGAARDVFSMDAEQLFLPEANVGSHLLPPELCSVLAQSIMTDGLYEDYGTDDVPGFLHRVLDVIPTLHREQTAAMIADFLEAPAAFLQGIDVADLLSRLLRRAAELPEQLVAELKLLHRKVVEWTEDQENLLTLGRRVVTVLILAIVLGNLLYPDSVYAKGHAAGAKAAGSSSHPAHHSTGSVGRRGGYYGGGWYGGGTNNYYYNRKPKGPIGPGPSQQMEKDMRQNSLPQRNDVSDAGDAGSTRVSLTADGQYLAIQGADGQAVYTNGKNWYSDLGLTPLDRPYPVEYKSVATSFLTQMVRAVSASRQRLTADKQELLAEIAILNDELSRYQTTAEDTVLFGTAKVVPAEAIRLTQSLIRKSEIRVQSLNSRLQDVPDNVDAMKVVLAELRNDMNA